MYEPIEIPGAEFQYGDIVYLKTDPDQQPRIVTAFFIRERRITYELSLGINSSCHDAIEITFDKDFTK